MMETTAENRKVAPCQQACPAGVDVPRYIRYIKEGNFDQALAVIRESIPFPSICGYACVHPCESQCARRQYDEPVAIRLLKRAAAEKGKDTWKDKLKTESPTGRKVAVIGAGPCGLTASYYLAGKGHAVTVFEALPQPGGMMRFCIPGYRLPNEIIDREISVIRDRGVEIKTNASVNSAESLLKEGFDAVLAASGAWLAGKSVKLSEASARVMDGIAFLEKVNRDTPPYIGNKVVVVGGGNTAIDSARAALRLGAGDVTVLYRRTPEEMPANPEEVREALEEGVKFKYLCAPAAVRNGEVICLKMTLGSPDDTGRPKPVPVDGSEFGVAFDTLIEAVGQSAGAAALGLEGNPDGTVKIDPSFAAATKGIFAAGDAATGPSSIIQAIAQGKLAASSIDRYLGGSGDLREILSVKNGDNLTPALPMGTLRAAMILPGIEERLGGFDPVEPGYDGEAALCEARRCLSCDLRDYQVEVNSPVCKECGYCREVCGPGVFSSGETFNSSGYKPMAVSNTEKCVGCLRCLMVCPDFAIAVQTRR